MVRRSATMRLAGRRLVRRARSCWLVLCIAVALPIPACQGDHAASTDPYVADLKRRCDRLIPYIQRETGRKLKNVEIVVRSREEITEDGIPWAREYLARIENGPRGDVLEAEARTMAEGAAHWTVASVDRRGRIVFPDPNEERGGLLAFWSEIMQKSESAKDPRELDLILLHELIHVHQHRHLESPAFRESIRSRADILARRAVLEGHAEYLTRKIASRIGLAELYNKHYRARTGVPSHVTKEWARIEMRISAADLLFAYRQGREFVASVIDKLGYETAVRRMFTQPPSLAAVSRPDWYGRPKKPSRWGPILEDLRRWLVRECGEADPDVLALPMVRELAGDSADAFREGFRLTVDTNDVVVHVLIADTASGALGLHQAWTRALERYHGLLVEIGLRSDVRRTRKPDNWVLHYIYTPVGHVRRTVLSEGPLIIDVERRRESVLEQGSDRLARRALKFLTDASWRKAWLEGSEKLLKSQDAGLRLAAVSRMRRFVPDQDWEVRWLGRWYEAKDDRKSEEERTAVLVAAVEDKHPAVVTRGLLAARELSLWEIPWPLLRERLASKEASVRRAAWTLMETNIGLDEDAGWQAPLPEALRLISAALDDRDVVVRRRAAGCLRELGGTAGLADVFRKALTDDDRRVRSHTVITLAVWDTFDFPELLPELLAQLDENPENAADALGNLGEAAAVALPKLHELLGTPEVRAEAAEAIWSISGEIEPLFALVRESVAKGSSAGIEALGEAGSGARSMVPEVAKLLAHENRWVRATAVTALGKIGGKQARSALSKRLEVEKDQRVLKGIREALNQIDG